jgi:hypothetical protein
VQSVEWFQDHVLAVVATDNPAFECVEFERSGRCRCALQLVEIGMSHCQNWNLEELAADCAAEGRYRFLLSATPEPVTGGTGAPSSTSPTA